MIPFFSPPRRANLRSFQAWVPFCSRILLSQLVSLACIVGLSGSAFALQGDPDKFTNMRDEIRRLEQEVSKKYSSMPIGFAAEQKKVLEEIEALKTQIKNMRKQLDLSAIESYAADPEKNQIAASHILNMGLACIDGRGDTRPFDPARAYELATLLGKGSPGGKPAPVVLDMAYRACMSMQDYERAERILKRIAGLGFPIPEKLSSHFEKLKKSWNNELVKREQEQQRDDLPRVKLETDLGDIVVELFEDDCPATVANFISLVESGFYNGTTFYEVKPSLVARAGCPKGNGTGDPGYRIANESSSAESRRFFAGTLGMNHTGANTAGSQFFFTYQPKPDYDLNYVAFGRIVEGLEVLYQIPRTEPSSGAFNTSDAKTIKLATVIRKRDHAYEPVKILPLPSTDLGTEPSSTDPVPTLDDGSGVPDVAPADDGVVPQDVAPSDDGG